VRPCIVKLISPLQNDVRCLGSVRMFWIKRAGSILPDARLQESLALQFCGQLFLVHAYNFISVRFFLAIFVQKRQRPSRSDGGCREKGVPSSGEKTVVTRNVAKNHCSAGAWLRPLLGIPR